MDNKLFDSDNDNAYTWSVLDINEDQIAELDDDMVNSPNHYTNGRVEVIEVLEDAVDNAPTNQAAVLQQMLLNSVRLWLKENPLQDAKKARWYLDRLISNSNEIQY